MRGLSRRDQRLALELDVKLLRYVAITEREHKEVFSKALHRVIVFCQERIHEEPVLEHLLRMLHEELACSGNAVGRRLALLGTPDC